MPEDGGACPPGNFKCGQSLLPLIACGHVPLGASVPALVAPVPWREYTTVQNACSSKKKNGYVHVPTRPFFSSEVLSCGNA